jgi:Tol biopolymer transport system component
MAPGIPLPDESAELSWGRVSPDGSYVVGTDGAHLLGVTLNGGRLFDLKNVSVSGMPAISGDAKKVAFTSSDQQLAMYDVATGELKRLGIRGQNPAWPRAGDRLAYDDGAQVRVFEFARVTSIDVGRGTEPSWSPDGTSLAVRMNSEQIDLVNVQSRERHPFIEAASSISVPRWSTNGEWMMYTRQGPRHWWSTAEWTGSEPSQILVRHVKSGTEGSIGEFYKANPGDFTWVTNRDLCRRASSPQ